MAVFSLTITVGGIDLGYFTDVTVTRSCDGLGFSGLSTAQLSFKTTKSAWQSVSAYVAAPVVVSGVSNLPTFYIDNRKTDGSIVTVTALDRMAFADNETFPYDSLDGTGENVQLSAVTALIADTVGFGSVSGVPSAFGSYYPRSKLSGISCGSILSAIAEVCVGVWYVDSYDNCVFAPAFSGTNTISITTHTALALGLDHKRYGVIFTDSDNNQYAYGTTTTSAGVLQVSSDLATAELAQAAYASTVTNVGTISIVSAESALMPYGTVPYIGLLATFAQTGTQYLINVVTAKITRNGVVCSLSTSDPNTSEIGLQGKLTKAVQNRVEYNKKSGCAIYTKYQGTVYVDEETEES